MIAPDPWRIEVPRAGYEYSILSMPAPEYYTGEVLLGSVYRALLLGVSEGNVNLEAIINLPSALVGPTGVPLEVWNRMISQGVDGLASPLPKGRTTRGSSLPQLAPLVPEVAAHACVMGKVRSRGNPANILFVALLRGLGGSRARATLVDLANSLSVGEHDDVFARFIESSLRTTPPSHKPSTPPAPGSLSTEAERYFQASGELTTPSPVAARFAADLGIVLRLKEVLTRRQWTVLIETLLRLGLGMQVLWTCRANEAVWKAALHVLGGASVPSPETIHEEVWGLKASTDPLLEAGPGAGPAIRRRLGRYAQARVGLNAVLFALEDCGHPWSGPPLGIPPSAEPNLASAKALRSFFSHMSQHRSSLKFDPIVEVGNMPGTWLTCQSGFTKNMAEFLIYGLGQLSPAVTDFLGYDQSFILAHKGSSSTQQRRVDRRKWVVMFGPSALVALVHACCRSQVAYSATMDDFRIHLAEYGILAEGAELKTGIIGQELRRLGLVVDSPDAGGGRLLVDPIS